MANDDIQGTITDEAGNPIEGAVVALIPDEGQDGARVIYRTTDANGDFVFEGHPQGDGTTQLWHVVAQYDDGGGSYNTVSKPNISAPLPQGEIIPDSGVFRWDCENSNNDTSVVADVWNNGYDGTVLSASYDPTGGNDGLGSYGGDCDISVDLSGLSGPFTITGWIYGPWSNGSSNQIVWDVDLGTGRDGLHYNNRDNNAGYEFMVAGTSVGSGVGTSREWVHVATAYDGSGTATVYINGALENTESGLSDPGDSGTFTTSNSGGFNNDLRIADLRQYDKALSNSEATNLFNTGTIRA